MKAIREGDGKKLWASHQGCSALPEVTTLQILCCISNYGVFPPLSLTKSFLIPLNVPGLFSISQIIVINACQMP
jgi:hypothetical protein